MAYIEDYAKHQTPTDTQNSDRPTVSYGKLTLSAVGVHFNGRIWPWESWDLLSNSDIVELDKLTTRQNEMIVSYHREYVNADSLLIYFDFDPNTNEFKSVYLTGKQATNKLRRCQDRAIKNSLCLIDQIRVDYPYLWLWRVDPNVSLRRNNR